MTDYQPSESNAPVPPAGPPIREPVLTRSLERHPAFTVRAMAIGALCVGALAVATPINDWVLGNTYLYNNHLPLAGTLLVLLLALVVNPLLGTRRLHLGEMVVVISMVLVLGGVVSSGLMRVFTGVLAGPAKVVAIDPSLALFNAGDGQPARLPPGLFVGIPEQGPITPSDPEYRLVVDGYHNGLDKGAPAVAHRGEVTWQDATGTHRAIPIGGEIARTLGARAGYLDLDRSPVGRALNGARVGDTVHGPDGPLTVLAVGAPGIPWHAWIGPALRWMPLLIAGLLACLAIAALVRKQWIEHERLPFPIAKITLAYLETAEDGRRFGALYYQPAFWIAFAIPCLVFTTQGLKTWGILPLDITTTLDLQPAFAGTMWSQVWDPPFLFQVHVYFSVLALAFFLPLDVSFSLWFFFVLTNVVVMLLRQQGLPVVYDEALYANAGGWLAECLLILWIGRLWYWRLLRAAVRRSPDAEIRTTARYVWLLLGSMLVMGIWLMIAGAQATHALLVVLLFLGFVLVLARLVAEAGMPYLQTPNAATLTQTIFMITGFQAPLAALVPLTYVGSTLLADQREQLLPYAMNAEYMATRARMDQTRRWPWTTMMIAVLVAGLVLAGATMLITAYIGSGHLDGYWAYSLIHNGLTPIAAHWQGIGTPPADDGLWWRFGLGVVFTAMLGIGRLFVSGWPFHPLGYICSTSGPTRYIWFSIMLGWLVKLLVMRYGGLGVYQRLRPVALGLIAGEAVITGFFLLVQLLLRLTGHEPATIARFLPQ